MSVKVREGGVGVLIRGRKKNCDKRESKDDEVVCKKGRVVGA